MGRSRAKRIVWVLGLLAAAALVLPYVIWHPRRLNHDGFESIEKGMTLEETERLLGGPPGIYYPSHLGAGAEMTTEGFHVPDAAESLWYDDKVRFEIWFGADGRVAGKHRRKGWHTTTYTSRHTALIYGAKEPTPLEPRRYQTSP